MTEAYLLWYEILKYNLWPQLVTGYALWVGVSTVDNDSQ